MPINQVRDNVKKATQLHTLDLNSNKLEVLIEENSPLFIKLKDLNYTYKWNCRSELDKPTIKECLDLVRSNMKILYDETNCCGGWNERSKLQILNANSNFYLLILDNKSIIGFICYRFIAIQECQPITPNSYRGIGIGSLLIKTIKNISNRYGLDKVMCTCIKANKRALDFYYKCGFSEDQSDPDTFNKDSPTPLPEVVYKILKL